MDLIGQMLGEYQIVKKIGSGSMAEVYKAYQASMDRFVAIKIFSAAWGRDEAFRDRLTRDARAMSQLYHSNILTVWGEGEHHGRPFIVMEYVESPVLAQQMGRPFAVADAVDMACQIGDALAYAHRRGICHGHLDPKHIFMLPGNHPLLADLGMAAIKENWLGLTRGGALTGAPGYLSPEQGQGLGADYRSDIYALGVLLYEMLTGRLPYQAESLQAMVVKQIVELPPPPRQIRPDVPPGLQEIILKALSSAPQDRFGSIADMVRAIKAVMAPPEPEPQPASQVIDLELEPRRIPGRPPSARRIRPTIWLLGGAGLLLILLLVWGIPTFLGRSAGHPTGLPAAATDMRPFTALPSLTAVPSASPTYPPTPLPTLTPTVTPTPSPTWTWTPTPSPTPTMPPTAAPSPTPTSTLPPTPTSTATPSQWAVANLASTIFIEPRGDATQVGVVGQNESVPILGRANEARYGRWLYVRNGAGVTGFVFAPRFTFAVNWDALPVIEPGQAVPTSTPTPARN